MVKKLVLCLAGMGLSLVLSARGYAQVVSGGGINPASPGAIGGTTSNTGQFTLLCTGSSPCALPPTTGDLAVGNGLAVGVARGGSIIPTAPGVIDLPGGYHIIPNRASLGRLEFYTGSGTTGIYLDSIGNLQMNGQSLNANAITSAGNGITAQGGGAISSTGGNAPTLTAGCNGAGSSVTAGSTNNRGQITTQTAASTTCTITWTTGGPAWPQAPFCVFMGTPGLTPGACGTSTCVVNYTSISAATPINYVCL